MRRDPDPALRHLQQALRRPLDGLEWALEAAALAGWLAAAWLVAAHWGELPERFPTHFDLAGRPDGFGPPSVLVELLAVQGSIYALLTGVLVVVPRLPTRFLSVPTRVTEANAPWLARVLRWNLRGLKVFTTWMLTYVAWRSILVARGAAEGLGGGFVAAVILISHLHVLVLLALLVIGGSRRA